MHPCARTTPEIRAEIRASTASVRQLARTYGVNPKTIQKWKKRTDVADAPPGRKPNRSTVLTPAEEAMCVGFRKHALLPLDDCLYALQWRIPHLSRSALHRLFRRHGVSRLPEMHRTQAATPRLGDFYLDTATVWTGDGNVSLLIAFDRTSKLAHAGVYTAGETDTAANFLTELVGIVPYRIRSVLTSRDPIFLGPNCTSDGHPFVRISRELGVRHALAPADDAWIIWPGKSSRQVQSDRDSSRRRPRPPYPTRAALRDHFLAFFDTYNRTRRLKTLGGQTPQEFILQCWKRDSAEFRRAPNAH